MHKLIYFLFVASSAFADGETPVEKSLLKPHPQQPLINEVVKFEPVAGHKFNLKAKNDCGNGWMISESEESFECQMSAPGTSMLELFVCDQKNTFCRREEFKLVTQQPQGFFAWLGYYKNNLFNPKKWSSPNRTDVSLTHPARGFMHNNLKEAVAQAAKEKKNLVVYFTQLSCPPCRIMKETSFASDEFQDVAKDIVRVQVDFDIDIEPDLVKPLNIMATPAILVFNKDFKELDRRNYIQSPKAFAAWLNSMPTEPIASLIDKKDENLTDAERARLAKWKAAFNRMENGPVAGDYKQMTCDDPSLLDHAYFVMDEMMAAQDKKVLTDKMKDFDAVIDHVNTKGGDDALQCAYVKYYMFTAKRYVWKHHNNGPQVAKMNGQIIDLVDRFPKLPGVTDMHQLMVLKAESQSDDARHKAYQSMKEQNTADYSFDYYEAANALDKKKYDVALANIDKSLAVAKDRSWQKAFLLKLDILAAMKKNDEALKLIDDVLGQLKLPASSSMKVHIFVQNLRKKQTALQPQEKTL